MLPELEFKTVSTSFTVYFLIAFIKAYQGITWAVDLIALRSYLLQYVHAPLLYYWIYCIHYSFSLRYTGLIWLIWNKLYCAICITFVFTQWWTFAKISLASLHIVPLTVFISYSCSECFFLFMRLLKPKLFVHFPQLFSHCYFGKYISKWN